jgi:thymidylate synthase
MYNFGTFNNANELYIKIAYDLLHAPEYGPRGYKTKELINTSFTLTNPLSAYITLFERNLNTSYIVGELLWYVMGRNDVAFISQFSKFWEKITDDGKTSNSAYGYIIQKKFNFNQLDYVIETLIQDKDSRRAVIVINTPFENQIKSKDIPCTMNLQFIIRNNKLDMFVNMRSNDFNFGLPYDIIYFTLLQEIVYNKLKKIYLDLELGNYNHHSISTHVYERDYDMLKKIANKNK